jgi:phosphomethylpyrimidine synthase
MPASHPASRKVYVTGSRAEIRVPMREITLSGDNAPLRLYDTSGPYTDPNAEACRRLGSAG